MARNKNATENSVVLDMKFKRTHTDTIFAVQNVLHVTASHLECVYMLQTAYPLPSVCSVNVKDSRDYRV